VAKNSHQKSEVILSISDASISPQLNEIIKCYKLNKVKQFVFIVADDSNLLLASIKSLDVPHRILPPTSKFGIIRHFVSMVSHLFRDHPKTFIASGQYATYAGIPAAFLFHTRNRIYIRHHSNFHHKVGMRIGLALDALMNYFSTNIVAVSNVVRDILINNESVPEKKVTVIHNGIDLEIFKSEARLARAYNQNFRIGVISRMTEWKGVEYTATAFKEFNIRHPNSYLHIVGARSDSFPKIESILDQVPHNNFQFEPVNLDIPGFLQSIDVLVHVPLELDDEAFGIVYIEALATDTPGIFTISGILNELINPERFFSVVPSRRSDAILEKLEEHFFGNSICEKIPPEWLDQFSLKNQGLAYLDLLKR
jgi:glycosyltransferase involved in cell wall biosynthesis